jgi:outer membrane immunogenic protein
MTMKKAIVAALTFSALVAPAMAADLYVKAPPPPALCIWCGFYIGANVGWGWTDETYTTTPRGTLISVPFDGSLGWGQTLDGSSNGGVNGGGQIGYNWQVSSIFVVGFEAEIQAFSSSVSNTSTSQNTAVLANNYSTTTPWFGTLRGRLGTTVLSPNLLLYGTGGLAYGQENVTGLTSVSNAGALLETFAFSGSNTGTGYAAGGGAEWAFAPSWTVKAEYLYVDLGGIDTQRVRTGNLGVAALPTDAMTLAATHDKLNIVRVGLNYKFW